MMFTEAAEELTVILVDAPSNFEQRVRTALSDANVVTAVRRSALARSGVDAVVVLYQAEDLDVRLLTELARLGPTVVVAQHGRPGEAGLSLDAGADGYLDATIGGQALRGALLGVARGELAYGRGPFGNWLRTRHQRGRSSADLTPRQRQIIELIATGAPDKEIAAAIGVRPATVQKHVARLLHRLGVRNRAAAVAVYRRHSKDTDIAS